MAKKKKNRRTSDEVNALQGRMVSVKKRLPKGAVTKLISLYPEYNRYKPASRVRLVFNLSVVDEEITKKFEALADIYEGEVKAGNIN